MQYHLPTDMWSKYASLAAFDPVSMTMVGLAAAGGGLTAAGTIAGGANAAYMGWAQAAEAGFEANQARLNAGADVAAAQQRMMQTQLKTGLTTSAATARAAGSGLNAGVGSAVENVGEIGARGRYAAALDLWNGQNAAAGDLNKAQALQFQGALDILGGQAQQNASYRTAGGQFASTIASAGSSAYSKYGQQQ
jgi:hypothetical protein